ncbi:MAG: hypothetical protein RIS94_1863 [Pseudomonadota bacterium]|jgi:hypothetical protein
MATNPKMRDRLEQAETINPAEAIGQPQPLLRELPAGLPYPVAALGPLREAVEAVQRHRQAPVALPAQSALAVASLAVQGFANVETLGGGFAPLSLYCLTIAGSGERKSACDDDLMQAVAEYEREQDRAYRDARKAWAIDLEIWKKRHEAILAKVKKGTVDRGELVAIGPEPEPPARPERLVSEPTYEGLTRLFAEGQPSLGLFSNEGGQFLGGVAMSQDNRQKTLAAFNDLWQGNPIKRTRQGDGTRTLYGRRLALHLMAQPIVAHAFLADPLAGDTGFLPRCLICEPPSTIGTRLFREGLRDIDPIEAFADRLGALLNTGMAMDPETRALNPRRLYLSDEARARLEGYYNETEAAQAPGGAMETIRGHASKTAEQAARIAGVLTLWRDMGADTVGRDAMACGIDLARYYLSEALRLAGAALVSEAVAKAEALRVWMLSPSWGRPWLTVTDILQRGPNRLREAPEARKAIEMLEGAGWLIPHPKGTELDGKCRRESWRIVRT